MRKSLFIVIPVLAAIVSVLAGQDFNIKTRVDLVPVPTSVRDSNGKLVSGLTQDDFSILEDDKPQVISNFSSDLQPLSAAIVIDTGMGGISLRRLVPSFISVTGAFGENDEMALFRYDHLVQQLSDFTHDPIALEKSFDAVKTIAAKQPSTVPPGEPAPTAPKILQVLLGMVNAGNLGGPPNDPLKPQTGRPTPVPTSRDLFEAVYDAAKALETRSPDRHRIIFMFSDGQVAGANGHSLEETVNMLLRDDIELYAVSTDSGALEGRFSVLSAYARRNRRRSLSRSIHRGDGRRFRQNHRRSPEQVHHRLSLQQRDHRRKTRNPHDPGESEQSEMEGDQPQRLHPASLKARALKRGSYPPSPGSSSAPSGGVASSRLAR